MTANALRQTLASRTSGFYRRFPLGVRRIGVIGATGDSLKLSQAADAPEWIAQDDWLRREGVISFLAHPLMFRAEILGVLAVFSWVETSDQEFAWLRVFADSAAVAIANATAFEVRLGPYATEASGRKSKRACFQ